MNLFFLAYQLDDSIRVWCPADNKGWITESVWRTWKRERMVGKTLHMDDLNIVAKWKIKLKSQ